MSAFARFIETNPERAGEPYGGALAATLRRAFPAPNND